MSDIIEVVFKGNRKEMYVNPQQFPFKVGDYVIVAADKGEDLGIVNQIGPLLDMKKIEGDLKAILRKPETSDLVKHEENRTKEKDAYKVCREKIEKHALEMKLVDVEYQFDGNKITFYFTAERRVDFRELVKELAAMYRVRIELRQIGVRDEARRMGGYGICGRKLCCTSFITDFEPITTQCAKEQNLPLNPQKLSGACSRLMCCLVYERWFYQEAMKKFPLLESKIKTPKGDGEVDKIDVFSDKVYLKFSSNEGVESEAYTLEEINGFLRR
jgi:cell fate regulator YaaT (PSP1 superfamily)